MLKPFRRQTLTALVFALSLINLTILPGQAQRSDADLSSNLLEGADCVVSGTTSYSYLIDDIEQVSIGRQVFDRLFFIRTIDGGNSVTLSCRADSGRYSLLDLQIGITDDSVKDGINVTIDVFQGGTLRYTYSDVQPGSMISTVLDLNDSAVSTDPSNVAIEMTCHANRSAVCKLQFITAKLYPSSNYTSLLKYPHSLRPFTP